MKRMAISVNQLLEKIESELHKAKQAGNSPKLRENVHSIKILCELILEENNQKSIVSVSAMTSAPAPTSTSITPTSLSAKKLDEEEANGDSLFDF
jgi:hypothetical protein